MSCAVSLCNSVDLATVYIRVIIFVGNETHSAAVRQVSGIRIGLAVSNSEFFLVS